MTPHHVSNLIDARLHEPVLVFGSLPPTGRDLDLLVPRHRLNDLHRELADLGFAEVGGSHVRFADCSAYAVDVVAVDDWSISQDAAKRLFDEAKLIEGYRMLMRPSPAHALLILARRVRSGTVLDDRRRARLARVLDEDPEAWAVAAREAGLWGYGEDLAVLRNAVDERSSGTSNFPAPNRRDLHKRAVTVARGLRGRRRRGVIALSGLDGSGKSTHAEHLRSALAALGVEAEVEWTKIARDPSLRTVARPVKRIIGLIPARIVPEVEEDADPEAHLRHHPDGRKPPPDAAARLRQRRGFLNQAWTLVVALANASTHRRIVNRHVRRSAVVICDRYVLDSRAHLRYRYGARQRLRLQGALIRWLSPRPAVSFLLDVSPETARRRKPEQYTTRDLHRLRALYLEEANLLGTLRVDAEAELEATCALLAAGACRALTIRRAR